MTGVLALGLGLIGLALAALVDRDGRPMAGHVDHAVGDAVPVHDAPSCSSRSRIRIATGPPGAPRVAPCEGCALERGRHVAPKRRADRPVDSSALAVTTYGGRHRARVSA